MKSSVAWLSAVALSILLTALVPRVRAAQFDLAGPVNSGMFVMNVTVLPNGNFVVTDPGYQVPGNFNVGAVYLYDGVRLAIISTLTGSAAGDQVGNGGVTVLSDGNFLVRSTLWNGSRGAATWGSGTTGVTGMVSAANSLVGSTPGDQVGSGGITLLSNGNYVVDSPYWRNGAVTNAGAVTWGSGTTGVTGMVSAANSLVGSTTSDVVGSALAGSGITALNNGNYVVCSSFWNNGATASAGAVTWGSGTLGVTGVVSAANSLVGRTANDNVGVGVTALNNGNYVVHSYYWHNGAVTNAGAVTWSSGTTGVTGQVSVANSLVGTTAMDNVGAGVTALNNGNYVVTSYNWHNGAVANAGAVTWGSGTTGVTGAVSSANSLIGTTAMDAVGLGGVTALNNGNYVVSTPNWHNGAIAYAGAATWGSGASGVTGAVSSANSLVGDAADEFVGTYGVTALSNGNYVVSNPSWRGGAVGSYGAVTWSSGTNGVSGTISAVNSLVGSAGSGDIGTSASGGGVTALNNGNYVVQSPNWFNGAVAAAGAVTWGSGTTGLTGQVSVANSLVGSTTNDQVGLSGVTALANGNYVVSSPAWHNGTVTNAGAVTWGSGTTGVTGVVSAANSLVGSLPSDRVGTNGAIALANGNYVVHSALWGFSSGAVTWGSGTTGVAGPVSPANSLVGAGSGGVTAWSDGNYAVSSPSCNNGTVYSAGAVTWGDGTLGTSGTIATPNSVLGTATGGGSSMVFVYDLLNTRLLVGYPAANRVSLFGYLPKIAMQQLNINLTNGSTAIFGAPLGTNDSLTFTIKNINLGSLTGLGITIDGSDAALFTVTASPTAPVGGPFGSTPFTVRFTPTSTGVKTAALHIASNDTHQNPFNVNLSGQALLFTQNSAGDGLNDAAKFYMSALGFDWRVSQPSLVNALFANANYAGLYTSNQLQALNVGGPLIQRNPTNGLFTLTIGVQKATNLLDFSPFPMTAPQTTIDAQGQLEFQFSVPDNAAFFRLQSK
jgi:hypothetical protein